MSLSFLPCWLKYQPDERIGTETSMDEPEKKGSLNLQKK